ncbi:NRPS-like enzyme [Aspergillus steynii IBT 23096]|uniref:NRPS-like enzyme n=1 Tax=Aspergillus steynii IBT 23096 TaxID=1392250 RepID=A0A2I2GET7_9EURO|nr:NRPS-like enzyme [Aspergillus steynii IBT 23096]PLB51382.1 NRPS-like enzyme [Aspergillus steynii IBT 23096]
MTAMNINDSFDPTEQLLPHIVDHYAAVKPDAVYAEFPQCPTSYDQGYRGITYRELASAINALAWWLVQTIGLGSSFKPLAYIGPNDVRYVALALGAVKAGYTACPSAASAVLKENSLRVLYVPDVEDLLQAISQPILYEKAFSTTQMEPLLTIHTSGSTGMPKPMTLTHASAVAGMRMFAMPPPKGRRGQNHLITGKRVYSMLPPFHGAYLACHLMNAVPFDTVMVAPIASAIPSAAALVQALNQTNVDVAILAPLIVEELAQAPDLLEYCAQQLECILYAGGDLPQHIGDHVATKIPLYNQYGSTELGLVPLLLPDTSCGSGDWKYLEFHPDLGLELRPSLDGQHELYSKRQTALERQQLAFTYHGSSDMNEYATGDIFEPHPNNPGCWKWVARRDDILILLNGEKTNPISMEHHLMKHPSISCALVVGAHHIQPALLLEGKVDNSAFDQNAFVEKVWPTIQEANRECPAHARIAKSHILFANSATPMSRSGKGTIQRVATVDLYESAIERLYCDTCTGDGSVLTRHQANDPDLVSSFILSTVKYETGWEYLALGEDFFARGMDSLQTLNTARALKQGLGLKELTPSLIYNNPSVSTLTLVLMRPNTNHWGRPFVSAEEDHLSERKAILTLYREMIDGISPQFIHRPSIPGHCVLLTKSTGSLGVHLLHELLKAPVVNHVYCIMKIRGGRAAQIEENEQHNLEIDLRHVTFLQVDLSHENFGLERQIVDQLYRKVTLVIHNDWPINLNWPLVSFSSQLCSLVNLIRLCSSTKARSVMFFVSSIGALMGYQSPTQTIPESVVDLGGQAVNGYAESRYMAEHLLDYASRRLGIQASIARLTYVPESTQRASHWDLNEWLPSLMIGSFRLGVLPGSLGPRLSHIDWIPVDLLSEVLVELSLSDHRERGSSPTVQVHHPVNLRPSSWESMMPIILEECRRALFGGLQVVSLKKWTELTRRNEKIRAPDDHDPDSGHDISHLLGRLTKFYETVLGSEDVPAFPETKQTARRSALLSTVPGVQEEWIRKWVREWLQITESRWEF